MTKNLKTLLLGFTGGVLGALLIYQLLPPTSEQSISNNNSLTPAFAAYEADRLPEEKISKLPGENFVKASKLSTESVVYIKTVSERYGRTSWLELWLGGGGAMQQVGSGSGVIFKENGYILTNNHVIDDADKIEVVIKKRIYEAKLVGRDPSTDLAILKIDANNFPALLGETLVC